MELNRPLGVPEGTEGEGKAIAEVVAMYAQRRSGSGRFEVLRVGERLQQFLSRNSLTLKEMVSKNLGHEVAGTAKDPTPREELKGCLRGILNELCGRGLLALEYERCAFSVKGLVRHRNPVGLRGYPEAIKGVYPEWLIPMPIRRGFENNAQVPERAKSEFAAFAKRMELEGLNEATLWGYWENFRDLVLDMQVQSVTELEGAAGANKIKPIILRRGFTKGTSTIAHWRRILGEMLQAGSPFKATVASGDLVLKVPKRPVKPIVAEGRSFHQGGKRRKVIAGIIMETRLRFPELRRLVHFRSDALAGWRKANPSLFPDLFAEAQEDALVKFWCIIKDRPVELWAHNFGDWKLYPADAHDPEGKMFDGDGEIFNNYREGVKKERPNKPFPKYMARHLKALRELRTAAFAPKGSCDQHPGAGTGLIRLGVPLWVDPRTGRRASQETILAMLRRGLIRAGISKEMAEHITGYWFRKGIINAEWANGVLDQVMAKTGGHLPATFHAVYIGQTEMAVLVATERKIFWEPLGIVEFKPSAPGGPAVGSPEAVRAMLSQALTQLGSKIPAVTQLSSADIDELALAVALSGKGRIGERDAAAILSVSESTLRRYTVLGLVRKYHDGPRRIFYSRLELEGFRDKYATAKKAALFLDMSDRNVRKMCAQGVIAGAERIGGKAFLVPWSECRRLKLKRRPR